MHSVHVVRRALILAALATTSMLLALVWSTINPLNAHALSTDTIVNITNTQRAESGLGPLSKNSKLNASANAKAQDMLAKSYWAHTSPDGLTAWTFMSKAGYSHSIGGENLSRGYLIDSAVVAAWMASPTHKANILNSSFRDIGIGIASGTLDGEATTIVVAHYGSPLSSKPAAPSAPKSAAKVAAAPKTAHASAPKPAEQPKAQEPARAEEAPAETPAKIDVSPTSEQASNKSWLKGLLSNLGALQQTIEAMFKFFAQASGLKPSSTVV